MAKLSTDQINSLVQWVAQAQPDEMTCDECLEKIDEYAEAVLLGREIGEGLNATRNHLEQCSCCKTEFEALVDALKQIAT